MGIRTWGTYGSAALALILGLGCGGGGGAGTDAGPDAAADTGPDAAADSSVDTAPPPECVADVDCDDGVPCTEDRCAGNTCFHIPDDTICTGDETCRPTGCEAPPACATADDPRCDDGQACTTDSCDVATSRCVYVTDATTCDDGAFCNGAEVCAPFSGCLPGLAPDCADAIDCTIDRCNEVAGACENVTEDRLCGDGTFCNGAETCDATAGCVAATAIDCDDTDVCTVDSCDEDVNACVNAIVDADMDGDGDSACGGLDCNDGDPDISSLAPETCNGADDDCDGMVDEGVLSACGDCDPTCRVDETTGLELDDPDASIGAEFDPASGGLIVGSETTEGDFLWLPNTAESTMSRWDARTETEIARYRIGLPAGECPGTCCWTNGCNMPSRVAVDGRGDAYVASRGFGMQGTVTKIASSMDDCVDRNGNGMIDTAIGSTPLAYGEDECVLWTAPVGAIDAVLRALTVDGGDVDHPEGYPWAGGYNTQEFYKLDPDTGAVLQTVNVAPLNPYGAIVLADGELWVGTLSNGAIGHFSSTDPAPTFATVSYPAARACTASYGLTADTSGRLWMSGWTCRDALGYDPATDQWTTVDTTSYGVNTGRGITVDSTGEIWMAVGGDGASSVAHWSADAFVGDGVLPVTEITRLTLPAGHSGPSGVGADRNGFIWVAHHVTSQLVRIDPATTRMGSFTGPNRVYTYSDFTGSMRRTVIGEGFFTKNVDAGCDDPTWRDILFDVVTPGATTVQFTARTAAATADLDMATPVAIATTPPDTSPAALGAPLTAAGETHGRHLRLQARLSGAGGESPTLRSFSVVWSCP